MTLKAELENALQAYDGKAVSVLSEIASSYGDYDGYTTALIALASHHDEAISAGATWMLKDHLAKGHILTRAQTSALVVASKNSKDTGWATCLHLCQCAQYIRFSELDADIFIKFVEPLLAHTRPFVRAWALNAICELARQHMTFLPIANGALQCAETDAAASVQARARNIKKSFP